MPKKKLKLAALEVDSFATQLTGEEQILVNGGTTAACTVITDPMITETTWIIPSKVTVCLSIVKVPTKVDHSPCPATPYQTKVGHASCPGGQAC